MVQCGWPGILPKVDAHGWRGQVVGNVAGEVGQNIEDLGDSGSSFRYQKVFLPSKASGERQSKSSKQSCEMQVFETIEMAFLRCFVWVSLPIILHTNRNLGTKLGLCIIQSNRRKILFFLLI